LFIEVERQEGGNVNEEKKEVKKKKEKKKSFPYLFRKKGVNFFLSHSLVLFMIRSINLFPSLCI
jgi:hypothetical protein